MSLSQKPINCNQAILEALLKTKEALSDDAQNHIKSFLISQKNEDGGFMDRAGKSDLYYTVFGYTLALVLDLKLDIKTEKKYLERFNQEKLDFVHSVCLVRAYFLIHLIDLKQKSGFKATKFLRISFAKDLITRKLASKTMSDCSKVLWELENYISKDEGYNHNVKCADQSTVYANYLMWTLYQDLQIESDSLEDIQDANRALLLNNGSYANESNSADGVTSTTAAGLIMNAYSEKSKDWLLKMRSKRGGFMAATGVPIADLLSTSTALLALKLDGENMQNYAEKSVNFINLHWDQSGGFFGSIADMTCDVEYTYYALLGLGVLS